MPADECESRARNVGIANQKNVMFQSQFTFRLLISIWTLSSYINFINSEKEHSPVVNKSRRTIQADLQLMVHQVSYRRLSVRCEKGD